MRARTRAKNEAHGVLARNLCERPPLTEEFGTDGRRSVGALELPVEERPSIGGCLRQVDFFEVEIGALEAAMPTSRFA